MKPGILFLSVFCVALALSACGGRSASYRYKLTLAVDTPDGVKAGSSVVEVQYREAGMPIFGVVRRLNGEALYLDLGPGKRPLVVLLTKQLDTGSTTELHWTHDMGPMPNFLLGLYGTKLSHDTNTEIVSTLDSLRGLRAITAADLPHLVTFADVADPKSVIGVDPNDLQATLGVGVKWRSITIECTNEPVTTGIEKKLSWLTRMRSDASHGDIHLDGERYGYGPTQPKYSLANSLTAYDFLQ
jgi:hypothetical protein